MNSRHKSVEYPDYRSTYTLRRTDNSEHAEYELHEQSVYRNKVILQSCSYTQAIDYLKDKIKDTDNFVEDDGQGGVTSMTGRELLKNLR
jgi:hypothetical protein